MNNSPVLKGDRIGELDLFRGFAILGIFMVNILVMNVSFAYRFDWETEQIATGWLQHYSLIFLESIFYNKFFTIFSFLFGIGVALQMEKAREKGTFSNLFFIRRFSSLFLFGVLHILLLWAGDILHIYGMLGLFLLILFRLPPKALLWLSIILFLFPFFPLIFSKILDFLQFDYDAYLPALTRQEILELKHQGSYFSGIVLRLKEYAYAMELIFAGITPIALSMMLFGGYLVKAGWMKNLYQRTQKIKLWFWVVALVVIVCRFIIRYWVFPTYQPERGTALSITLITIFQLGEIFISLAFLWILTYLWNKHILRKLLTSLQYVGRMAFTNYIMQSVLGYLIMRTFNGYEYFTVFGCILLVLGIYIVQIFISKLWLNHFKFGPLEWLWRSISYMRLLPIKK